MGGASDGYLSARGGAPCDQRGSAPRDLQAGRHPSRRSDDVPLREGRAASLWWPRRQDENGSRSRPRWLADASACGSRCSRRMFASIRAFVGGRSDIDGTAGLVEPSGRRMSGMWPSSRDSLCSKTYRRGPRAASSRRSLGTDSSVVCVSADGSSAASRRWPRGTADTSLERSPSLGHSRGTHLSDASYQQGTSGMRRLL